MSVANTRLLAAFVLLTGVCELARPQTALPDFRGELTGEPGKFIYGYTLSLLDLSTRLETVRTDVDLGGNFTLHGVTPGEYTLRVCDRQDELVHEEFLTLKDRSVHLRIDIRMRQTPKPVSGSVSVKQLQHPPSAKAVQAFTTAMRFSESGKYARATEELEKAVRLSPEFAQAYTNLAAQHIRGGQFEQAVAESKRAMELAAANPKDLCNMAVALWSLNRIPEALAAAERALALDPGFINAHFVAGSLLAIEPRTRAAGIQHLERAAPVMPVAATNLARVRAFAAAGH